MITFAAPWALAGLAAAMVPILLHLFARREPPEVEFPAVRYLSETARVHQHRLNIQHLLLLLARTLLVVALVLAAAGPTSPSGPAGSHGSTALVLILDNSLSSGATAGGIPVVDRLRETAAQVIDRSTPADALWLMTAEGTPRRGTARELREAIDTLTASPRRLDLGESLGLARDLLAGERLPGEVVIVTDQQASAVTPGRGEGALIVARPDEPMAPNAGIAAIATGPQPWTAAGGAVTVFLAGADTSGVPLSLTVGNRRARQALAAPDRPVTLPVQIPERGWIPVSVELAPDEVRGDDQWTSLVRVAPAARVRWDPRDRYLAAAFEVLRAGGRVVPGADLTVGTLGAGPSLVLPPPDLAQLGALNRALAARGVTWRFGPRTAAPSRTDSSALLSSVPVLRSHVLEPTTSGETGVLIRADGTPWLVRSGDIVLVGSRFDPEWTGLPLSASFVPFLDAMVNRIVRGEVSVIAAAPGDAVILPDGTERVGGPGGEVTVEGGARFHPAVPGLYYLIAAGDTIGTVSVNPDPRESVLTRATDRAVGALWKGARITGLEEGARLAFTAAARRDLRPPLLWFALVLGVIEVGLAAWRRHK